MNTEQPKCIQTISASEPKIKPKKTIKIVPHPTTIGKSFRLFDFNAYDYDQERDVSSDHSSLDSDEKKGQKPKSPKEKDKEKNSKNKTHFMIQMFGVNESGETCALFIEDFEPFFYIKVGDDWSNFTVKEFEKDLQRRIKPYFTNQIKKITLVQYNQLYGFTGGKNFKFLHITFQNITTFNKVRNLWYSYEKKEGEEQNTRKYTPYYFQNTILELYESKIPPLLRYFHIQNISPSGWITIHDHHATVPSVSTTTCDFEYYCKLSHIFPLPNKETRVPYKICSFDIEASSSHGDFPIPIKTYKRLVTQIVDVFQVRINFGDISDIKTAALLLSKIIKIAFSIGKNTMQNIDVVYPKNPQKITKECIQQIIKELIESPIKINKIGEDTAIGKKILTISNAFERIVEDAKKLISKNASSSSSEEGDDEDEEGGDAMDSNGGGGFGSGIGELPENKYNSKNSNVITTSRIKVENTNTVIDILLSKTYSREEKIALVNEKMTILFPPLEGDQVTFIGSTFLKYGDFEPYKNHCVVVGDCAPVEGAEIDSVSTERELLVRWAEVIQEENPDIIIGYNIFGFDYEFMFRRAQETHCVPFFLKLSRIRNQICVKTLRDGSQSLEQTKNRLASGDYDLRYPSISGRLQIDLLFYFRRDYNLSSYKLDDVAGTFIRDDIKGVRSILDSSSNGVSGMSGSGMSGSGMVTDLYSKNLAGLHVGDFIHIEITGFTSDYYMKGKKFRVIQIRTEVVEEDNDPSGNKNPVPSGKYNVIRILGDHQQELNTSNKSIKWGMAKDDVTPQDIFRLSKGSAQDRAIVAKYCIQDCNLVHHLMNKIDILTGYIEMSRICNVPISFLVFRGQGIKLTSYVAKTCREKNTLMPDLEHEQNDDGYEGAIVLPPKCMMYVENPVACVDYSSLYPSIAKGWNLSPNSKVWTKIYDMKGNLLTETGEKDSNGNYIYDNLPEYKYVEVEFDTFQTTQKPPSKPGGKMGKKEKVKSGKKVCRWAQFPNGQEGIIPAIIGDLLKARSDTRIMAENEKDPFIANVLDKRQLGYKVTANSLYGQMGSSVSTFFEKDVAASITAIGRMMITYAKRMVEEIYGDSIYVTKTNGTVRTRSSYVYGDTDSVFFTFNLEEPDTGAPIRGKRALEITIELAQEVAKLCSLFLPPPMKLAYEKTLMSFILLSKKRYVGMLYETNPNKGKLKFMGLPLKRRDSCDYLKDVYGGILTILMKDPNNIQRAIEFLEESLKTLIEGKVSMDKLAITKSLRSDYKNPGQIAHKVLAERMGERDPGNKPKPGDRIKYVFIVNSNKNALLGERIEPPEYIIEHKLPIDYTYYITNQLMNPLQQLFGLALEKIYDYKGKRKEVFTYQKEMGELYNSCNGDLELFMKKKEKYCSARVKMLLFDPFLTNIYNKQNGIRTILQFYSKKAI